MDRNIFALSLGLAGLLLIPAMGRAAPTLCSDHDAVQAELARQFGEQPQAMALAQEATELVLSASETGTSTRTVTLPGGMTCLVVAGDNFESVAPARVAKGDPA